MSIYWVETRDGMGKRVPQHQKQAFKLDRFLFLLVALTIYIGIAPFIREYIKLHLFLTIAFSAILISVVYAISHTKRQAILVTFVVVPMLVLNWLLFWIKIPTVFTATHLSDILFLAFTIAMILRFIIQADHVTRDVLFAAVVVYLLIGVTWSMIYALLEHHVPGSFDFIEGQIQDSDYAFIYYSFVTLTTLGYGDVTPLTSQAGALVILEALIGQLYLAIMIARLVGLHISYANLTKR